MKDVTREFMRGRFECLVSGAKVAQDLFESYLAEADNPAEKQEKLDRLFKVLKGTKKTYDDLLKSLKQAIKEGH